MKSRRAMALVLVLTLALALVCGSLFAVLHAHHDCDGLHCAVCRWIAACTQVVKKLAWTCVAFAAALAGPVTALFIGGRACEEALSAATPVRLRVKLSN